MLMYQDELSQSCEIPCHQHCRLGQLEAWTACTPHMCGPYSYKSRTQVILQQADPQGTQCPFPEQLLQVRGLFH